MNIESCLPPPSTIYSELSFPWPDNWCNVVLNWHQITSLLRNSVLKYAPNSRDPRGTNSLGAYAQNTIRIEQFQQGWWSGSHKDSLPKAIFMWIYLVMELGCTHTEHSTLSRISPQLCPASVRPVKERTRRMLDTHRKYSKHWPDQHVWWQYTWI